MFCTNCGTQLPDGTIFCDTCGTRLEGEDGQAELVSEPTASPNAETTAVMPVEGQALETPTAVMPAEEQVWETSPDLITAGEQVWEAEQAWEAPPAAMPEQAWEAPPAVVPAPPLAGPQEQPRAKKSVPGWAIGLIAALAVITLALGVGGVLLATGVIPLGTPDKTASDSKASVENSDTNEGESKGDSSNKDDSAASKDGSSGDDGSAAGDEKKKAEKVPTAPPASFGSSPSGEPRSGKTSTSQNSYIVQDSQRRILSTRDIAGLSDDDLARAQNEIWARHGRMFNNQWLQNYFNSQSWYSGTIPADQFLSQYKPTSTEEKNAALMIDVLNEHGYDVNRAHPN